MAIHGAFTNAAIFFGSVDLSGNANNVSFGATVVDLDNTTFASGGAKTRQGGLTDSQLTTSGFAEFGSGLENESLWNAFSANTHIATVSPTGGDGTLAYTFGALSLDYKLGGAVGDLLPFSAALSGRDQYGPIRGNLLIPKTTLSGTGATNGSVATLGAVGATQKLYASLHVFSQSAGTAPTLDVVVKSAAVSFTSPTNRIAFTQVSGAGVVSDQFATPVAGPITDTFWRVTTTIGASGGTPVYTFAVVVGIQ